MPRKFYVDINRNPIGNDSRSLCDNTTEMWDGTAYCNRPKGHKVDELTNENRWTGEFHQEAFEGWIWDEKGNIG